MCRITEYFAITLAVVLCRYIHTIVLNWGSKTVVVTMTQVFSIWYLSFRIILSKFKRTDRCVDLKSWCLTCVSHDFCHASNKSLKQHFRDFSGSCRAEWIKQNIVDLAMEMFCRGRWGGICSKQICLSGKNNPNSDNKAKCGGWLREEMW